MRVLELGAGTPPSLEGLDVSYIYGSVLDKDAVTKLVAGAEQVYHIAAKVVLDRDRDGSVWAVNVEGTRNVAQACLAENTRMVHCSSHHALVLAPLDKPLDESKPLALNHKCDYHRSKAHGQQLIQDMVRHDMLNAVIINPGTLTGPYDYEPSMLGASLLDLFHGRLPAMMSAVTDCADARDVAAGAIAAAEKGRLGEHYLLTGRAIGMREMAGIWAEISNVKMPRIALPLWVAWAMLPGVRAASKLTGRKPMFTANMLRASVSNDIICYDKAMNELGYAPRPVRESLSDMFEFFRAQGWAKSM